MQPAKPKRRLVDLSVTLDNNPYTDPPPLLPKIDYMDHQQGWPEMAAMFPGLQLEQMPGKESWAAERLQSTHRAPWTRRGITRRQRWRQRHSYAKCGTGACTGGHGFRQCPTPG